MKTDIQKNLKIVIYYLIPYIQIMKELITMNMNLMIKIIG